MKKNLENHIQRHAFLIYLIVALLCGSMVWYVYRIHRKLSTQKAQVESYSFAVESVNRLITDIHHAQYLSHLYLSTAEERHYRSFRKLSDSITLAIEALAAQELSFLPQELLRQTGQHLQEKTAVIKDVQKLFVHANPLDSIGQKWADWEYQQGNTPFWVRTSRHDTIIRTISNKSFWGRLGEAFAPKKSEKNIAIQRIESDTLRSQTLDSLSPLTEIKALSEGAEKKYSQHLKDLNHKVSQLMLADQKIATQLSSCLLQIQEQMRHYFIQNLQNREENVAKNLRFSIALGLLSMLMILVFVLLILHDVNQGKKARKAAENAQRRTQQLLESRHQLFLSVSHDIKAPLSSISGYLDLFLHGLPEDKKIQAVASMQRSSEHILALLENLLEYSRLEQGLFQCSKQCFSLSQLCQEIDEMFRPLAEQKKLALHFRSALGKDFLADGDRLKLKQIFINLLSNALKYTAQGEVSWEIQWADGQLLATISDSGTGISEEQQKRLFLPFSRLAENQGMAGGSGLGLYVVKGLLESMDGKIELVSEKDKGSRFTLRIPLPQCAQGSDEEKRLTPAANTPSLRILAIDDDSTLLSILKKMLNNNGHHVSPCNNAADFRHHVQDLSGFDLVITDMEMGDFQGTEVLHEIRHQGHSLDVWVMTARSDYDAHKAQQEGFQGYLPKPFSQTKLAQALGKAGQSDSTTRVPAADLRDFPLLHQMLEGDTNSIREVLEIFYHSTQEHLHSLHLAISDDDFLRAQGLCHKMLPFFVQLEQDDLAAFLKKMDLQRGCPPFEGWAEELQEWLARAALFLEQLQRHYLSSDKGKP